MNKKTIIFIGKSGSGKGTQSRIIQKFFKKKNEEITYIELGDEFRDFLKMTTHTSKLAKKISKKGKLQPEFLAIQLWSKMFNLYYSPENNLILDGTPRTRREAHILEGALRFYEIEKPYVIYLKTSEEISTRRMLGRKRKDDGVEKIKERMRWFDEKVLEVIDYFRENDYYDFMEVDGDGEIEEISRKIIDKVGMR